MGGEKEGKCSDVCAKMYVLVGSCRARGAPSRVNNVPLCEESSPPPNVLSFSFSPLHRCYLGFRRTRMTESPRRNILLMNLSLFCGVEPFFPFPDFGISVHISLTFSRTMLQCRSKALMCARSLRLFLRLISTCAGRWRRASAASDEPAAVIPPRPPHPSFPPAGRENPPPPAA